MALTIKSRFIKRSDTISSHFKLSKLFFGFAFLTLIFFGFKAYACEYNAVELRQSWDQDLKEYTYDMCKKSGISYDLITAIIWNESRFQSDAKNINGNKTIDRGLMQINDSCVEFLKSRFIISDADELFDPYKNIESGIELLSFYMQTSESESEMLLKYQLGETGYKTLINSGRSVTDDFERVMQIKNIYEKDDTDMVSIVNINSIKDIQDLQELAIKYNEDVAIHSMDDSVMVDVKSFIGLFALDMSKPVKVVCENPKFHSELNIR